MGRFGQISPFWKFWNLATQTPLLSAGPKTWLQDVSRASWTFNQPPNISVHQCFLLIIRILTPTTTLARTTQKVVDRFPGSDPVQNWFPRVQEYPKVGKSWKKIFSGENTIVSGHIFPLMFCPSQVGLSRAVGQHTGPCAETSHCRVQTVYGNGPKPFKLPYDWGNKHPLTSHFMVPRARGFHSRMSLQQTTPKKIKFDYLRFLLCIIIYAVYFFG